jgi:hypothetical protein
VEVHSVEIVRMPRPVGGSAASSRTEIFALSVRFLIALLLARADMATAARVIVFVINLSVGHQS